MASNLTALQESYIQGLRQLTTGSNSLKGNTQTAEYERPGLGSRSQHRQGKEYAFFDSTEQLRNALAISNRALLVSLIFWAFIVAVVYNFGGYILMYARITSDDADLEGNCLAQFSPSLEDNLQYVHSYPKGDAGPYIARFPSDHKAFEDYPVDSDQLPPLVTGAASRQFFLLQGFIKHVHADLKVAHSDIKLIVYDLGLYAREKEILKQYCGCEVRSLDYSSYPAHVADTDNFAWRPIIMQEMLEEYGAVVYADVTTRFKSANSLKFVRTRGQNHMFVWDTPTFMSQVAYTSKLMFNYFNESRCLYSDAALIDSQLLVFFRTSVTWNDVMKPWLKCALNVNCISPSWSRYSSCLHFRQPRTTGCHHFDLSALGIIVNRGHQMTLTTDPKRYTPPRLTYFRDDEPALFLEQPWTTNQLLMLCVFPVLLLALTIRKHIFRFMAASLLSK